MPDTITTLVAIGGVSVGISVLALGIYASLRSDMRQMRGEMLALRTDLTTEIKASERRLQSNIREAEDRLSTGTKANAERIDALEGKLNELGEKVSGLGERVAQVDGKLEFLCRFITRQNEPPPVAAE